MAGILKCGTQLAGAISLSRAPETRPEEHKTSAQYSRFRRNRMPAAGIGALTQLVTLEVLCVVLCQVLVRVLVRLDVTGHSALDSFRRV